MSEEMKLSKVELLKEASHQLRGTLAEELANDQPKFSDDAATLLKHHGSYLQDDRDTRKAKGAVFLHGAYPNSRRASFCISVSGRTGYL